MASSLDNNRTTVHVLGSFRLERAGAAVRLPMQAQRVVGFVAVTGRRASREVLAGRLWPYSSQQRADANLRTALWKVGASCPGLLETTRTEIALDHSVEVDLRSESDRAYAILTGTVPDAGHCSKAAIWTDDLLAGWDEEWLVIERERVRQLRMHSLEALARALTAAGRHGEAIDTVLAVIATEPLRESARLVLLEAHLAEGNAVEARRSFEDYAGLLRSELGLEPSAALTASLWGVVDRAGASAR